MVNTEATNMVFELIGKKIQLGGEIYHMSGREFMVIGLTSVVAVPKEEIRFWQEHYGNRIGSEPDSIWVHLRDMDLFADHFVPISIFTTMV